MVIIEILMGFDKRRCGLSSIFVRRLFSQKISAARTVSIARNINSGNEKKKITNPIIFVIIYVQSSTETCIAQVSEMYDLCKLHMASKIKVTAYLVLRQVNYSSLFSQ